MRFCGIACNAVISIIAGTEFKCWSKQLLTPILILMPELFHVFMQKI